jgi:hypothetical protein
MIKQWRDQTMKNLTVFLGLTVTLVMLLIFPACGGGGGTVDSAKVALDGQQAKISFVIGDDTYAFSLAAGDALTAGYTSSYNETCVIGAKGNSEAIHIYFPGKSTGTFTYTDPKINDAPKIGILLNGGTEYYSWEDGGDYWFSIAVTSYGSVGQRIEGTFEGKLVREGGSETIEVTDGVFSVNRHPDA